MRSSTAATVATVVGLHVVGLTLLLGGVGSSPGAVALGTAGTAYLLGVRHAFDADHIAAIDNVTRKLVDRARAPLTVGLFFSLGHSSVVLLLCLLLSVGGAGVAHALSDDGSLLHQVTSIVGPAVSGSFLLLVAAANVPRLAAAMHRRTRWRGEHRDGTLGDSRRQPAGPLARVVDAATRKISAPWHMYPLGLVFGLGFDTATEIGLLALASGAAVGGTPVAAALSLPILFAAGMSLCDSLDGAAMGVMYRSGARRQAALDVVLTGTSIVIAVLVGSAQLVGVLATKLELSGAGWQAFEKLTTEQVGMVIVGTFVLVGAAAWGLSRHGTRAQSQP